MKQLKRLTSVLLVLGIVLGLMPLSAFAAEPEDTAEKTFPVTVSDNGGEDTYIFKLLADGTVELKKFSTTAEVANAVIPSTAQEHPTAPEYSVTSIGNGAFSCCTKLKTVKLPDSVTSVGAGSFYECTKLEKVYLGNSVRSIGVNAFAYCIILDSVTPLDSIVSIGTGAFGCCYKLGTVNLGNSVDSIGEHAFSGCAALKTVNLGNSVDSIGEYAFAYCTILESVTIPSSVQTIGANAFYFGFDDENKQLEVLHYTGTKAQWDVLMDKKISYTDDKGSHTGSIRDLNPMLKNPKEFHYAPTVSFDCGDPAKKTSKVVEYEGIVTPPDDPTAEGYQFKGWYTQENGGELFNFEQKITKDVTVYAHWSQKYTLTEQDGTLVHVTFVKNGKTVDITENVELKKDGTTQIGKIPEGAMVTVKANAAPGGKVFAQWNISDPALMEDPDVEHTSQTMTFPMPEADVKV